MTLTKHVKYKEKRQRAKKSTAISFMKELIEKGQRAKSKQKSETFSLMTFWNEKKIV